MIFTNQAIDREGFSLGTILGSRKSGLNTMHTEGTKMMAPIKHEEIDTIIRKPKNFTGTKFELNKIENPITTESALNMIPRPVVSKVCFMAST